ncbi:MAG: hypothetical protein COT39_01230 [Parcubacteria group bacterium CG08_land_8_20_14_0_20_48_21]|nr:MAG: hypothetical protein COT39_01230 [Parcubacteria group bacterium CG08_land_8_20_14_0_20_48_21]PIW79216.1 MAG: hypothetical protein COZ99_02215 [Parcubacteria group bacterium CG_4_8_14_3_um_filter_48_16]PIZ77337.1 MAG: hypothetical protein COY03_03350 [bacterium CG_4_10_14_0_2_um_filter_48_144]
MGEKALPYAEVVLQYFVNGKATYLVVEVIKIDIPYMNFMAGLAPVAFYESDTIRADAEYDCSVWSTAAQLHLYDFPRNYIFNVAGPRGHVRTVVPVAIVTRIGWDQP